MDEAGQGQTGGASGLMEAIVSEYEEALLRYASRILQNPFSAQDVVQNVFIQLCRKWKQGLQPSAHLKNWLYRVTHNEAVDHIRRESLRPTLHEKAAETFEEVTGEAVDPAEERRARVLDALKRLHPREQQVVLLRLEEGLSYAQIAEITGRSQGNVGNILHHAIVKLSGSLAQDSKGASL
jgi:RNA polymerase sigma factor (sigma-70 family)